MASVMVETPHAAHTKLHKRNPPDNVRLPRRSPTIPSSPFIGRSSIEFKRNLIYDEQPPSPSSSSLKIKSYGRRASAKDGSHVDLSRSMAENETLTALGLGLGDTNYTTTHNPGTRTASDVSFTPVRAQRHRRSTSGASHISTSSNGPRQQPSTYVNPLRQTPRPYSPPMSMSYTSTGGGSDPSVSDTIDEIPRPADETEALRILTTTTTSTSPPPSLSPFPTFDALPSSTTTASTPIASPSLTPTTRSRGATLASIDSPSSRPSLDKALLFIRGQRSASATDVDSGADARAASIRAARRAYAQREMAKERKAEEEEMVRVEREAKRQVKRDEQRRRRSGATDGGAVTALGKGAGRGSGADEEKRVGSGAALHEERRADARERGGGGEGDGQGRRASGSKKSTKKKRGAKSTWAIFLAWFRTRLLRLGG